MDEPRTLGRYRFIRPLAAGGMGEVVLARHEGPAGFAKTVVIKRILPHLARDQRFVDLFLNEARLAALLSHPNVVQIFELGEADGSYFIAMEYIDGRSVRAIRKAALAAGGRVPVPVAARICSLALQGLHYAHELQDERGQRLHVVHRDISPDNLLVSFAGAVKVVDFGIARAVDLGDARFTRTVRGKFHYMAPEQLAGEAGTAQTDIYAVGVLLYELLTGHRPFDAPTPQALSITLQREPPPNPSDLAQEIPSTFDAVVQRALAPRAQDRFATAEEMARAIEEALGSAGADAGPLQISAFMRNLFPRDAERDQLAPAVPAGTRSLAGAQEVPTEPQAPSPTRHRSILRPALAAAVALTAVVAGTAFMWPTPPGATAPAVRVEAAPKEAAAAPPAQAVPLAPASLPEPAAAAEPPPPVKKKQPVAPKRSRRAGSGLLTVRVHPWAEVVWKRKSLGTTPLSPIRLPAGDHVVVLKNSDLKVEKTVRVSIPAGGTATIEANLMRDHVEAQSRPAAD